jgi:hypothetical protein
MLHLHGFQCKQGCACSDAVTDFTEELTNRAGHRGFNFQASGPLLSFRRSGWQVLHDELATPPDDGHLIGHAPREASYRPTIEGKTHPRSVSFKNLRFKGLGVRFKNLDLVTNP